MTSPHLAMNSSHSIFRGLQMSPNPSLFYAAKLVFSLRETMLRVLGAHKPKKRTSKNPESFTTFCPLSITLDNTAGCPLGQHVVTGLLLVSLLGVNEISQCRVWFFARNKELFRFLWIKEGVCFFRKKKKISYPFKGYYNRTHNHQQIR